MITLDTVLTKELKTDLRIENCCSLTEKTLKIRSKLLFNKS